MGKKKLQESETRVIKRSQIRLNPYNVKRHADERIRLQEKNLKKVGYLGGIVWNETTGNLIDGHRRVQAMDKYYGDEDYDVKVEVVRMDEKEEKKQLVYMGAGDTSADIDLIAKIADDIELVDIGFGQGEIDDILNIAHGTTKSAPVILEELFTPREKPEKGTPEYEEAKATVKGGKALTREMTEDYYREENSFVTLSFSTYDNLCAFYDLVGANPGDRYIKGEEVLSLIN